MRLIQLSEMTADLLMRLAKAWGVSEEEAVRRAVEQANAATRSLNKEDWMEAFKELKRSLSLTPTKAAEWQDAIREARR